MPTEEPKKFKRPLPVELTEDEKVKKGHKAGLLKKQIQKIKGEMKEAVAGHKEQLKEKQAHLDSTLDDLEAGNETRSVECFDRKDFTKKKVEVVRADTNEVIESRTMSMEEMQVRLPSVKDVPPDPEPKFDILDTLEVQLPDGTVRSPKKRGRPRKA